MGRLAIMMLLLCATAVGASAASQRVEDAKRVFGEVSQDADRLGTYCAMIDTMYAMEGDKSDPARVEGYRRAFDGLMTALGPDFRTAWATGDLAHATDEDAKEYQAASAALEARCPPKAQ